MKIQVLIFLFFISPVFIFSQVNCTIDFVGGIEGSYRYLTSVDGDASETVIPVRNRTEVPSLNWRIGFNYNVRVSDKIFLKSGLRYFRNGYQTKTIEGNDSRWPSDITGIPDTTGILPFKVQSIYTYNFVEIPLIGRYEFKSKKLMPFVEVGLSPSVFVNSTSKLITDLETTSTMPNYDFNRFHLVGSVSFGVNYSLSDTFQLFGQPTFRYHFTPLVRVPVKGYLYNYGIEFGIRHVLR